MSSSVPERLANGAGQKPDADKYMENFDFLAALLTGSFIENGGFEEWNNGTSFSDPATDTEVADNWTYKKSGTTPPTADVDEETTTVDSEDSSIKIDITGAGSGDSKIRLVQSQSNLSRFGGRTLVFGAKVRASTASKIRLKIDDGSGSAQHSSYHSGGGTFELLQAIITATSSPSEITVSLEIDPSDFTDTIYMDSAYLYDIPSQMTSDARETLPYIALVSDFLSRSGGVMIGDLSMGANEITNVLNRKAIRQVVFGSSTSGVSTTSTSFQDTNLTASLTPKKSDSIVYIFATGSMRTENPGSSTAIASLARDSTELGDAASGLARISQSSSSNTIDTPSGMLAKDTPGDTSAHTYKARLKSDTGSATVHYGVAGQQSIIAIEVEP